jgi:hypothetical protein
MRTTVAAVLFLALVFLALVGACSQPQPRFSIAGATVDATHWCPGGAANAAYDLHARIDARNDTSRPVTIESASATMVLAAVTGPWLEQIGEAYDAGSVKVTPTTVAATSRRTLDAVIPSACTSGSYGSGPSISGDYTVKVTLETSAGRFVVTASNRHEIRAA